MTVETPPIDDDVVEPVAAPPLAEPVTELWQRDKNGKEYVTRPGRRGPIYRREDESIAEAIARDEQPKDQRPRRRRAAKPKMPPASTKVDLKALEKELAEALRMPAVICAAAGDEWSAQHFTNTAPFVARNLVQASEHNPWLRRKLEEMASGQAAAMQIVSMLNLTGAVVFYLAPPVIYWFNLPVPDKAREMFSIPDRRENAAAAPFPPSGAVAA